MKIKTNSTLVAGFFKNSKKIPLGLSLAIFSLVNAQAQSFTTAFKNPTVAVDDQASGDWGFYNAGAVMKHDNEMASATAVATLLSGHTDYLRSTGFGMSVPAGVIIKGIELEVEKSAAGVTLLAWINDYRVRLIKNGVMVGSNRARGGVWPTDDKYYTYGGPADLWGTTWTAAEVNSPGFGLAFSAEISELLGVLPTASLDHIRLRVTYQNLTLPVKLINFKGQVGDNHSVKLSWSATGENANSQFVVQRSVNGSTWSDLKTIEYGTSGLQQDYQYTDQQVRSEKVWYRIATKNNGLETTYSEIVTIRDWSPVKISLFPNPGTDLVTVESASKITSLQVFNTAGMAQPVQLERVADNVQKITITPLHTGLYYVLVNGEMIKLVKK